MIHLQLLTPLLKEKLFGIFFLPQSSGLYIGGSWERQHIQLFINLGAIAHKEKTHAGENVLQGGPKEGGRGRGGGASADKTGGRRSELMSDALSADFCE